MLQISGSRKVIRTYRNNRISLNACRARINGETTCITERYKNYICSIRKPQVARSIRVAGSRLPLFQLFRLLNGRPEGIRRGCVPFVGIVQGGLAPFVGIDEASFSAEAMTGCSVQSGSPAPGSQPLTRLASEQDGDCAELVLNVRPPPKFWVFQPLANSGKPKVAAN